MLYIFISIGTLEIITIIIFSIVQFVEKEASNIYTTCSFTLSQRSIYYVLIHIEFDLLRALPCASSQLLPPLRPNPS